MKLVNMIVSVALALSAAASHALEIKPYSAAALEAAQKAERPVALLFHADWCPTCRVQERVLGELQGEPGLDVTVLVADYDTERALKRRFNVRAQSTLVVLRGERESARLVGDTARASIRDALTTAL
jgi:thioredoxin 1